MTRKCKFQPGRGMFVEMRHKHTGLELAAQVLLEEAQNGKVSLETLKKLKEERGKKK